MTEFHLRDYQQDAIDDVRGSFKAGNRSPLLVLPTGGGKCLGRGTPVMMHDGTTKPVEAVNDNDLIMGPDSSPRRVVSTCSGREMLYRVTPTKGDPYVVNESHILSLKKWDGEIVNIGVLDYLGLSSFERNQLHGWRVPGVLIGDTLAIHTKITVEPIGVGDYFGFELDGPDRLFLLGDFTVTHNTYCFCYISANASARGNKTLILVHRVELLRQTSDSLRNLGVAHGLIAPGVSPRLNEMVQVASVQTVVRRFDMLAAAGWSPDLIVPDEAHHATAGTWRTVLTHWPGARILGVTATPERGDGKGLGIDAGGIFDDMVVGPQIYELIDAGHLAPIEYYAPPMIADLKGVRSRAGDYARGEAADRMDKPTVTGDAVAHYAKICPGVPAIAFCVSVEHAKHVAEEFNAAGWRAASLDGTMSADDRKKLIDDLGSGRLDVLTSCDIVSEGTDIPIVGCAILLRPTKSLALFLQQVGRVLRLYPGKMFAYVIDHVGNASRHGMPDDPRDWSLAGKVKRKRGDDDSEPAGPPPPYTCDGCFRQVKHPLPHECPNCGKTIKRQNRADGLKQVDGELVKITADDRKIMAAQRRAEQAQAKTLDDLVAVGMRRGYKNPMAWAAKVMRGRGAKKYMSR